MRTLRALPTLFQIGFASAVAYRAEFLVWILSTTMPLVMLALWSAVARDAPVGRFGQKEFALYFLVTFIVRQLTGSWVVWSLNYEIRQGALSMRLLRPLPVPLAIATENLAALPLRGLLSLPVAVLTLFAVGAASLPHSLAIWAVWVLAIAGGWWITFCVGMAIGSLAFFFDSSIKVMEVWLALFFVFSGYMIPLELFPPGLQALADWLPFRYQIGFPVELLTGAHDVATALRLLALQWSWVALAAIAATVVWRRGLRRFGAFGG